jgi:hypothetical protein
MTPGEAAPRAADTAAPAPVAVLRPLYRWYNKLGAFLLIVLSLAVGLFLVSFPWTEYWEINYFALLSGWHEYWTNPYVRGAVSGLGVLNLYVSLVEVFRLRRFARR